MSNIKKAHSSFLKRHLVRWKERVNYASGLFSFVGTPVLVAGLIQEKLGAMGFHLPYFLIFLSGLGTIAIFGYCADKYDLIRSEHEYAFRYQAKMIKKR